MALFLTGMSHGGHEGGKISVASDKGSLKLEWQIKYLEQLIRWDGFEWFCGLI
jgi:hypothetical protein